MTQNTPWIAALGAICCLLLPMSASGWTVGERGDEGSVFLYDEQLEGVYGNSWWGKSVGAGGSGPIDVRITGEGKTADFDGVVNLNCANASGHSWKSASNFGAPVKGDATDAMPPDDVVLNARKIFCPQR